MLESANQVRKNKRTIQVRRTVGVFALLVLVGGGVIAAKVLFRPEPAAKRTIEAARVRVEPVEEKNYPLNIISHGKVKPYREVLLVAEVAGKIQAIEAESDSQVKPLSALEIKKLAEIEAQRLVLPNLLQPDLPPAVIFDTTPLDLIGSRAVAIIDEEEYRLRANEAWAKFVAAGKDYQRNERLFRAGNEEIEYVSEREYDQALVQFVLARLTWQTAWLNLKRTRVVSPFSGVVAKRYVERGDRVTVGDEIARVVDLARVKVVVGLTSDQIIRLRATAPGSESYPLSEPAVTRALAALAAGQPVLFPVTVRVDGSTRVYRGLVRSMGNTASSTVGTYPVEVVVDNPDGELLDGASAYDVRITIGHRDLITIPRTALFQDIAGGTHVFVLDAATAKRANVTLDYAFDEDESRVIVTSGLTAGNMLILPSERNLVENQSVVVRPPPADDQTRDETNNLEAESP